MCSQPGGLWTFITHGVCHAVGCPDASGQHPPCLKSGRQRCASGLISLGQEMRLELNTLICIVQSEMHFLLVTYLPDRVQQLQWIFSTTKHSLVFVANREFLTQTENSDKKLCKTVLQKFSLLIHPREATFWQASKISLQFHQHNERWASRFCVWFINIHVSFT